MQELSSSAKELASELAQVKDAFDAVRAGRVLLVPRLPFGWFDAPPALNRFVGIVWLSAVFHPQRVRHRLDERIVEVFEWLYHRRPSLVQVRELLGSAR